MVTILPIDVDQDLVREGLQYAVAERLEAQIEKIKKSVAELRAGGLVERDEWQAAFGDLAAVVEETAPVLEYARAFVDQWPEDDEDEDESTYAG